MESRLTALVRGCWGWRGPAKKEKELMDMDSGVMIAGRGVSEGGRGYKGNKA